MSLLHPALGFKSAQLDLGLSAEEETAQVLDFWHQLFAFYSDSLTIMAA